MCHFQNVTKLCRDQCNTDLEEVKRFELTTDLKNLPNSRGLKCYFYCFMENCGVFKPNSTRINVQNMMDTADKLTKEELDIMFGMGRGCMKRIVNLKDPHEIAYQLNVCSKLNDNEVGHKYLTLNLEFFRTHNKFFIHFQHYFFHYDLN